MSDKKLFLKFIQLERSVRIDDFETVRKSVEEIAVYTKKIDRPQLIVFAYMYLWLDNRYPQITSKYLANGGYLSEFSRKPTADEDLIHTWAGAWYTRLGHIFLRIVAYTD
ncbi:MAG TPA: hypothetical protein VEF76_08360 [Patescibacteria group bacterium]|nr:hypothetical protein [Patescibacteria group bacterium]